MPQTTKNPSSSESLKHSPFKKEIAEVWRLFKASDKDMKKLRRFFWTQIKESDRKRKELDRRMKEAERKREAADRKRQEAERKREAADRKRQEEAEQRRQEAERKRQEEDRKREAADRKRQEEAERKRQEEDRKRQEEDRKREAADRKRQEEAEQRRQEAERKRQEEDRKREVADRKRQEEAERKRRQDLDEQRKETDRRIQKMEGLFTSQWGKMVEALTDESLIGLMKEQGIKVTHTVTNVKGSYRDKYREFDIIAVNGKEMVVVEVKTTLRVSDVKRFLDAIKDFKHLCREYRSFKVYGGVAYIKAVKGSTEFAREKGLFVIRSAGKSAVLKNPRGFKPKELAV